jgi:hypothetical protein
MADHITCLGDTYGYYTCKRCGWCDCGWHDGRLLAASRRITRCGCVHRAGRARHAKVAVNSHHLVIARSNANRMNVTRDVHQVWVNETSPQVWNLPRPTQINHVQCAKRDGADTQDVTSHCHHKTGGVPLHMKKCTSCWAGHSPSAKQAVAEAITITPITSKFTRVTFMVSTAAMGC